MINNLSSISSYYNMFKVQGYSNAVSNYYSNPNKVNSNISNNLTGANNYFNKDGLKFINELDSKFDTLSKSSSKLIHSKEANVFNNSIASFDDKLIAATFKDNATKAEYNLDVTQIATRQINESVKLNSTNPNNFAEGTNNLTIDVNGNSHSFSLDVTINQTNNEVLNSLASSINSSKIGVNATIRDIDGKSALVLNSTSTGELSAFTTSGNISDTLELNNVVQMSQDAKYILNGKEYTSTSNNISVDSSKVQITLKDKGNSNVAIEYDKKTIAKAVETFVNDYNSALDTIRNNPYGKTSGTNRILNYFKYSSISDNMLSKIGISKDSNGRLALNEKTFAEALDKNPDMVVNYLGKDYGIAKDVLDISSKSLNVSKSSLVTQANISSNTDFVSNNMSKNSYCSSQMLGILFNTMI